MPWRGPEYEGELPSLGWEILEWTTQLPSPRDHEKPLQFTDEQAVRLVEWYTVHPATGRFVYRRGCSRRAKGNGKSPVEAAKAIAELAGPVRFAGWDASGNPVGRPWGTKGSPNAWVQIAAVSEDQTANTHSVVFEFLTANEGKAADRLKIDVGISRCYLRDGERTGKLEPVTASAGSREGQPITYAVLDETFLWTPRNGGVKLARTIRRNVAKMDGRTYETTNAFEPGIGSVAEGTHKSAVLGTEGIYYDAVEAPRIDIDKATDAELIEALKVAYGDSWWIDLDRIVRDVRDPDTPREDAERFFFNWNRSGEGRAIDPERWMALARDNGRPEPGTYVGLGFDGSITEDSTVLRGCTPEGYTFILGKWERPLGPAGKGWRVPRLEVDAVIREAFATYKVGRMNCDPPKWQTEIEGWIREFGEDVVIFFDTNQDRRMGPATDRWMTAIREGSHTHDNDPTTNVHVANAHKRKARAKDSEDDSRTLYVITKPDDGGGKIDAAVADILAFEAALTMPPLARREPIIRTGARW